MKGRDRTAEFIATINSKREKPSWIQQRQGANGTLRNQITPNKFTIDPNYKELMRVSQNCAHRIRNSFEKLEKFTILAKKRTLFDDRELNRLIADIRSDIGETKSQLDYLQSKCEPKARHTEHIVNILQRKLANVTSNFKSTLEMRSQSVQQQLARREMFDGPSTSSYHPHSSSNSSDPSLVLDMGGHNSSSSYYLNQQPHENFPNHNLQQQEQQSLLINDHIDLSERADKMQLIESTIVELGTVFNQLAHLVHDQGETITRIDMNISDTTANVEAAHDALLRYFASINSNRWLILKVFGVLFFFFVLFVMFAT